MNQWYPIRHWIFDEVYKVKYLLLLLLMLPFTSEADCGHGNNPCEVPGPKGDEGDKGDTGDTGPQGESIIGPIGLTGAAGGLNVTETKSYLDDQGYWTDSELSEAFAATTAMSGLDFDSTTTKLQLGIAVGGYDGEENMAIGVGKVWDSNEMGDILFSFKTTVQESGHGDSRPWVGSAVWKF